MNHYKAFGLNIKSSLKLHMLKETTFDKADVFIVTKDLSDIGEQIPEAQGFIVEKNNIAFRVSNVGLFQIINGSAIYVQADEKIPNELLSVYIMGSCMGAVLHQRGFLLLHGSSVCKNDRTVLIMGSSGAGKSTVSAEFVKNGWKLLTDDIACVEMKEGNPYIRPSYPSQKLWQDAIHRNNYNETLVQSLYQEERKEKYSVDISDSFEYTPQKLYGAVILQIADNYEVEALNGMDIVNQLMQNTYRTYMILPVDRQRWFQQCVTLSTYIKMTFLTRVDGKNNADLLFREICNEFGEIEYEE